MPGRKYSKLGAASVFACGWGLQVEMDLDSQPLALCRSAPSTVPSCEERRRSLSMALVNSAGLANKSWLELCGWPMRC